MFREPAVVLRVAIVVLYLINKVTTTLFHRTHLLECNRLIFNYEIEPCLQGNWRCAGSFALSIFFPHYDRLAVWKKEGLSDLEVKGHRVLVFDPFAILVEWVQKRTSSPHGLSADSVECQSNPISDRLELGRKADVSVVGKNESDHVVGLFRFLVDTRFVECVY